MRIAGQTFYGLLLFVFFFLFAGSITGQIVIPPGVCKDPRGCGPTTDPVGPPPQTPEQARLERLNSRFFEVLRRVKALGVPDLADFEFRSPSVSIGDLDFRVQRVYADTFRVQKHLQMSVESSRSATRNYQSEIAQFELSITAAKNDLQSIPAEIAGLKEHISLGDAEIVRSETRVAEMNRSAVNARARAQRTKESVIRMISSLLVGNDRSEFERNARAASLSPLEIVPPYKPAASTYRNPVATMPENATNLVAVNYDPPKISGVENKLDAIDSLAGQITRLRTELRSAAGRETEVTRKLATTRAEYERLKFEADILRNEKDRLQKIAAPLIARAEAVAYDLANGSGNVYRMAMTELVWDHIKDNIVAPKLKRIIRIHRLSAKADLAAALNEIRQNPRKLLTLSTRFRNSEEFVETMGTVTELIPNFTKYAMEASDRLGVGTWQSANDLRFDLQKDLGDISARIVENAGEGLDGPTTKLRRWLFSKDTQ